MLPALLDPGQDRHDLSQAFVDHDGHMGALVHPPIRTVLVRGAGVGLLRRRDSLQDVVLAEAVLSGALDRVRAELHVGA